MRKSRQEAARTRDAIVASAAELIRHAGIAGTSVADLMAAAGLTHGGFYRHFRNKEHLVSEALCEAGEKTITTLGQYMEKGGFNAAVNGYLSKSHRDAGTPVCPFAACGSEIARSGKAAKAAASEVLERLFATLSGRAPDHMEEKARADAIVALSTMVGAMTLARVVADGDLSSEILDLAKKHLHR